MTASHWALAVLIAAAACGTPSGAAEPEAPTEATMPAIFQVDTVSIAAPVAPDQLVICVTGMASTPGYSNIRLEPVRPTATPGDGVYELTFAGDPPQGMVAQVLTPVSTVYVWHEYPADLAAVRVRAASNQVLARLGDASAACQAPPAQPVSADLTGGTWLAEDIAGRGVIDTAQSTVTFAEGGAVSGSGGCNRYRGTAAIDGAALAVGPLASTRMGCAPAVMDQEQKFLSALEAAKSYTIEGAILRLSDAAGVEVMRLSRRE